jgi:hypothetical protein
MEVLCIFILNLFQDSTDKSEIMTLRIVTGKFTEICLYLLRCFHTHSCTCMCIHICLYLYVYKQMCIYLYAYAHVQCYLYVYLR